MTYNELLEALQVPKILWQLFQAVFVDLQLLEVPQLTHLVWQVQYFIVREIDFLQIHVQHIHCDELDVLFGDLQLCLRRLLVHLVSFLRLIWMIRHILSTPTWLAHLFNDVDGRFPPECCLWKSSTGLHPSYHGIDPHIPLHEFLTLQYISMSSPTLAEVKLRLQRKSHRLIRRLIISMPALVSRIHQIRIVVPHLIWSFVAVDFEN